MPDPRPSMPNDIEELFVCSVCSSLLIGVIMSALLEAIVSPRPVVTLTAAHAGQIRAMCVNKLKRFPPSETQRVDIDELVNETFVRVAEKANRWFNPEKYTLDKWVTIATMPIIGAIVLQLLGLRMVWAGNGPTKRRTYVRREYNHTDMRAFAENGVLV